MPYWIVLVLIVLFAFAPIGSVMLCGAIANAYGCKVDEGSVHPCTIGGHNYGELLYSLGVLGCLMLVTLPAGALMFVLWLIVLILRRANWRRRAATNLLQHTSSADELFRRGINLNKLQMD
jgi:hypothetical protein